MAARSFKVPILLPADPTVALEAATKQYVDGKVPDVFQQTSQPAAGGLTNGDVWIDTDDVSPGIPIFDTVAQRDSNWTTPPEGAFCFVNDSRKAYWSRINSAWIPFDTIWQVSTLTMVATGGGLNLGSGGVVNSKWRQAGKQVELNFQVVFGSSGVAQGSGAYHITPPVAMKSEGYRYIGSAAAYASGSFAQFVVQGLGSSNIIRMLYSGTWPTGGEVIVSGGGSWPWAWAANNALAGFCSYEAA